MRCSSTCPDKRLQTHIHPYTHIHPCIHPYTYTPVYSHPHTHTHTWCGMKLSLLGVHGNPESRYTENHPESRTLEPTSSHACYQGLLNLNIVWSRNRMTRTHTTRATDFRATEADTTEADTTEAGAPYGNSTAMPAGRTNSLTTKPTHRWSFQEQRDVRNTPPGYEGRSHTTCDHSATPEGQTATLASGLGGAS